MKIELLAHCFRGFEGLSPTQFAHRDATFTSSEGIRRYPKVSNRQITMTDNLSEKVDGNRNKKILREILGPLLIHPRSRLNISETVTGHLGLKKTKNNSYVDHTGTIMAPTC